VLQDLSDEQLMTRYQSGEAKAFELLMERHYQSVYNFLYRYTGNTHAAEDLLQDVWMRVIRGAESYQQRAKFTTWLYVIARRITIDAARKAKFRRHRSLDQPAGKDGDGAALIDSVSSDYPDGQGDRRAQDSQFARALGVALDRMNDDQRMVFVLREFQHMAFAEIATVVDVPENTVKSRMRYALEFLRKSLSEFVEDRNK